MRELVMLVADGTMETVFRAFFEREHWELTLGCGVFDIWPQEDIFHDVLHTDGGVHKHAQELLRPYLNTHLRAVVVIDQQFGGDCPAEAVRSEILERLETNGWKDRSEVVVIDPELEVWLWQDKPQVSQAVKFSGGSLRAHLQETGKWPENAAKPIDPKATIQALIKPHRDLKTKVVYTRIAKAVSVAGCTDQAFVRFKNALRTWFPKEGA